MEKKKPNRRSVPVTITLGRELLSTVDTLADAQNLTRSQFIERQVLNGIEQEKATVALLANPMMAAGLAKLFADPAALKSIGKALQEDVTENQVAMFERGIRMASDQAAHVLSDKKKGKGKKS